MCSSVLGDWFVIQSNWMEKIWSSEKEKEKRKKKDMKQCTISDFLKIRKKTSRKSLNTKYAL